MPENGKKERRAAGSDRTTAKDIRNAFFTSITGDILTISDKKNKSVLLQSRISTKCDPTLTNELSVSLGRILLKYIKDARKDIAETGGF